MKYLPMIPMMILVMGLVATVTRFSAIHRVLLWDGILEASITASQSYSHGYPQNASSLFLKAFILGADITCSDRLFQSLTILCVNEWALIVVSAFSFGSLGLSLWVVLPFIGVIRAGS